MLSFEKSKLTYEKLRPKIDSGDLVLIDGDGFFSKIIQVATGESVSHVGMFVILPEGVFIAEMVEGTGFQLEPASQRIPTYKGMVMYGKCPKVVDMKPDAVRNAVLSYRLDKKKQKYGYLSLLKVWWAQITRRNIHVHRRVCSTFVQHVWESCGYHFQQLSDPGDFLGHCRYVSKIEVENGQR